MPDAAESIRLDESGDLIFTTGGVERGRISGGGIPTGLVSTARINVYNVKDYGAIGDGTADDTAAIQAAINAAQLANGGTVFVPAGLYKVTSTLTITSGRVVLQGVTRAGDWDLSASGLGSTIRWYGTNGGGPVIQVQPVTNGGTISSGAIRNLTINGSNGAGLIAATGLLLVNIFGWEFTNLEVRGCSTVAVDMNSAAIVSGIKGVVRCIFDNIVVRVDSGVPNAIGFRLDSQDTQGDVNTCHFRSCSVHYYNGVGFQLKNCDTNWFIGCTSHRLLNGTGTSVEFQGSNTSASLTARFNTFIGFIQDYDTGTGNGPPIARGTTSYTFPSRNNSFIAYTRGNGNQLPVVETGATLRYVSDSGDYSERINRRADYLKATGFIALGLEPVSNAVPTSGTVFGNAVYLYEGEVITNIVVAVAVAGVGTAPSHIQAILWDGNQSTPTALAVSAEDAANSRWTSGTGWKEIPLTAPYTVPTSGIYYPSFVKVGAFGTTDLQLITGGSANPGSNIGGLSGNPARRGPTMKTGVAALIAVNDTGAIGAATSVPTLGVN